MCRQPSDVEFGENKIVQVVDDNSYTSEYAKERLRKSRSPTKSKAFKTKKPHKSQLESKNFIWKKILFAIMSQI